MSSLPNFDVLWQNTDNIFPIEATFNGEPFSPAGASKAEYQITNRLGKVVYSASLDDFISINDTQFIVDIHRDKIPFVGSFIHQFVIYDSQDDKLAPLFQRKLKVKRVY
jgi:hypothetical protein